MMQELLTRGIPGRHKKFKKTAVGEIPEEWRVVRLKDVAHVQTGLAKNTKNKIQDSVLLPYLRVANVQAGYVDLSEVKYIEADKSNIDRYLLKKGDVLFNEGGDNDKLGRGCVWEAQVDPCIHQNHVFAVRCTSAISPYFLALYAASPMGKQFFSNASKQTTNLASINSSQLKSFPLPLPSCDEQEKIVSLLDVLGRNEHSGNAYVGTLSHMKNALMQVLLTGDVRVTA
jgi:type I restriction enzyme S subunit